MTTNLEQAAKNLLAHWASVAWKQTRPTADFMADLREALDNTRSSIRSTSEYSEQLVSQEPVGVYYGNVKGLGHRIRLDVEIPAGSKLYTAPQPDESPAYIPYTDEELDEAIKLLDKAQSTDAKFSFIWETIYDHGNGKHLGALSRAQREVAWKYLDELKAVQPVSQEPVAWIEYDTKGNFSGLYREYGEGLCDEDFANGWRLEPLYTAPPARKEVDLTDDEIHGVVKQVKFDGMTDRTFQFARAVIAAYKEKNK